MPRAGLPEETKEAIRERVAAGDSQRDVAKAFGVNVSTISRVAADVVAVAQRCRTENATQARGLLSAVKNDFDQAARIALINKMAVRIAEALDELQMPRDLKDLAVAMGVAIDKRRLEDGESDGSPSTVIQIQAIDYRRLGDALAPQDETGPVGYLPSPGESQSPQYGATLG